MTRCRCFLTAAFVLLLARGVAGQEPLTLDRALTAAHAAVATAREDVARAERRRDAGMATDADVLALVVNVADLQQRAIQAEGDAGVARAQLNQLMGEPIEHDFHVIEPSSVEWKDVAGQRDVKALLAEADGARPELKRA